VALELGVPVCAFAITEVNRGIVMVNRVMVARGINFFIAFSPDGI
jgi:hypothetical protein